jgi:hypothetical protein
MRASRLLVLTAPLLLPAAAATAQEGTELRVADDGSGDFETITAAIEAATGGDTILIAPGTYVENLHIDKPLTLRGDGAREEIAILHDESDRQVREMQPDGPSVITIYVDGVDVTIERLSVMDEDDSYVSIVLMGGESVLRDIHTEDFVGVRGEGVATIEDSYIERLGTWGPNRTTATGNTITDLLIASEGSFGIFADNTVTGLPIVIDSGADFGVFGNSVIPDEGEPGIVVADPGTRATVTGNDIEGGWVGVLVEFAGESLIEDNDIRGTEIGVVAVETSTTVRGNTIADVSDIGIVTDGDGMVIEDNVISGGRIGVNLDDPDDFPSEVPALDEPPVVVDNTIRDASHFGIAVIDTDPVIRQNSICAGREAIKIGGDGAPQLGTNDICEPEGE